MELSLILCHLSYGASKEGVEQGPTILKENGLIQLLNRNGHTVIEETEIYQPLDAQEYDSDYENMKYPHAVLETCSKVFNVASAAKSKDLIPLLIGGDHSLGLGSVAASLKQDENTLVIWLDAHADMNTPLTSESHNIHGMPLSFLMKHKDCPSINWLDNDVPTLKPHNILLIGTRSIDLGEQKIINDNGIQVLSARHIKEAEISDTCERILEIIRSIAPNKIHLSIDLDALDPIYAPGTGVPEKDGLTPAYATEIIKAIVSTCLISSIDFVEFNPNIELEQSLGASLHLLKGL